MRNTTSILIMLTNLLFSTIGFSQTPQNSKIQLPEIPIETKHSYSVWRTDYYIYTGIAYAKSLGMTVEDFAEYVGNVHRLTGPNDTSIAAVVRTCHFVINIDSL